MFATHRCWLGWRWPCLMAGLPPHGTLARTQRECQSQLCLLKAKAGPVPHRRRGEGVVKDGELGDEAVEEAVRSQVGAAAQDNVPVDLDGEAARQVEVALWALQGGHEQPVHIDLKALRPSTDASAPNSITWFHPKRHKAEEQRMLPGTVRYLEFLGSKCRGPCEAARTWSPDGRVVSVTMCQAPSVRFRRAVLRKSLDPTCPSAAHRATPHFLTVHRMSACLNGCKVRRQEQCPSSQRTHLSQGSWRLQARCSCRCCP